MATYPVKPLLQGLAGFFSLPKVDARSIPDYSIKASQMGRDNLHDNFP